MADEEAARAARASAPCFMHEMEPGLAPPPGDGVARADVMRWRKAERARLIETRLAMPVEERRRMGEAIARHLDAAIGDADGRRASLYWPFRGEPDLRPWAKACIARGGRIALPVVVEKGRPLVFRDWRPGDRLEKGVWNIPVPADGPEVAPDIVVAPLVGFDAGNFRLGYGGGFFDRTLAAAFPKPLVIGVGYSASRLPTIFPLDHDIAMDLIVTERGIAAQ